MAGCASHTTKPTTQPMASSTNYAPVASAALVFDPPVIAGQPPLDLSRQERDPQAFVGFDQVRTDFYYVRFDDRQTNDFTDRFERRAISVRTGISQR
jgi:hypothetical protein